MLDVVVNFTRLTVDDLFTQLTRIVKKAQEGESEAERVGILTAGRRDDWARARMRLMQGMGQTGVSDRSVAHYMARQLLKTEAKIGSVSSNRFD